MYLWFLAGSWCWRGRLLCALHFILFLHTIHADFSRAARRNHFTSKTLLLSGKKATDLSCSFSFNVLFLLCFCRANELRPLGITTFARLEFSGFSFFSFSSSFLSFSFPSLLPPLPCAILLRGEQVIAGSVGQCCAFFCVFPDPPLLPWSPEVWSRVVTVSPAIRGERAEAESLSHAHTRGALEGGVVFLMLGAALEGHVLS